jgi:serine/threonine-protein kinase
MELLEGTTLRNRLATGALPQKEAIAFGRQIANGLSAAHEKGIVHRDLKPENLVVTDDGHVKILDFGLAKKTTSTPGEATNATTGDLLLTNDGMVLGTPGYMSPEQVRGHVVDHRSDIFSFGAILYEMLTGERAFRRQTAADTLAAILKEEPPERPESGRELPTALASIVKHCLEKSAERRFQSARDIAFALEEIANGSNVSQVTAAPTGRNRKLLVLLTVSAVVLVAAAAALFNHRPTAPPMTDRPSIAVLPFTNLSSDKDQEYFSDGLSEELMGLLAKVQQLHVAGHTSSFAFKGKNEDLATIGRKLHVTTVLEGSVRRSGDDLRVSTRLVSVADGYQIWAETYDRKMTDVFVVQDEIASAVVAALKVKLLAGARPVSSDHRTLNTEAYNDYLLARHFYNLGDALSYRRAVEYYGKATALDPGYAAAYAGLAIAQNLAADFAETGVEETKIRLAALSAADKAISLDPALGEGYAARAYLRFTINWDWAGAHADFRRALSLNPGDSYAWRRYGSLLGCLGRVPEAITATTKATDLDPLSAPAWNNLGYLFDASGRLSDARKAITRALELNPDYGYAQFNLGVTSILERNPKAAVLAFEHSFESFRQTGMAMAEHELGRASESQRALNVLTAKYSHVAAYQIAEVYAWRGERDMAFTWLNRAYAQRDAGLSFLKFDPLLAKIRDDPRYAAMLDKLNLPGEGGK